MSALMGSSSQQITETLKAFLSEDEVVPYQYLQVFVFQVFCLKRLLNLLLDFYVLTLLLLSGLNIPNNNYVNQILKIRLLQLIHPRSFHCL